MEILFKVVKLDCNQMCCQPMRSGFAAKALTVRHELWTRDYIKWHGDQINLSWRIKAESAQCEWRGAEVCANSIKPCCAMKGHFVWCERRKTFVYQSSSASGLALNVISPLPPGPPLLVRTNLECFLMSAPPRSQWDQEIGCCLLHTVTLQCRHRQHKTHSRAKKEPSIWTETWLN